MKKIIAILMAVMMLAVMSFAVAAEEAVPSVDTAPEDGDVIITDFDDIDISNPAVDRDKFKDIYDELTGADELSQLIPGVDKDSEVNKVVDITVTGDAKDKLKDGIQITIDPETDGEFTVVFKGKDGWTIITDYIVNPDGTITFTVYEEGVVAIIVPANGEDTPPQTSDYMLAVVAVMTVAGVALVATAKKRRA